MNTRNTSRPKNAIRILSTSAASLLAGLIFSDKTAHAQAIAIATPSTHTQNFDGLGQANVAWADNSTLAGWYAEINDGATATGNLQAVNGSAATTGLLNLGSTGSGERALGSKVTGTTANTAFGVLFQNTSGQALRITNISYIGELWRSNSGANTPEEWWTSYKVSNALFTDVESGPGNTNPNVGTYTALSGLNWSLSNAGAAVQLDGNLAANRLAKSVNNPGITLNAGDYFMFRWIDTNEANTDGHQAIDDFSITFAALARNVIWNTAHTVGGAPSGTWDTSANQYWLDGVTPTAFQANDDVTFSQNPAGTATIAVPADILAGSITVSHTSGTYSIGGAGLISGTIVKTGDGTLTLTSANSISSVSLGGGVTITQNAAALGGGLTVTAASTLQTDTDLTLTGGLSGTGALTKTGPGVLTVGGTGNGTGGVTVAAGKLRTLTAGGLGAQNLIIEGAALVFAHAAGEQTLNAATTIGVGAAGGEISVENGFTGAVNAGVTIGTADRITGSGTITKTGPGALRMRGNHPGLSSPWMINGGTVEYGTGLANALGTGLVTVNAGGELVGQNTVVPIPLIQLNGGALGTRTGAATDFTGTVGVTADSELRARSASTPTGQQPFAISGQVTGTGALTITGALPDVNGVIPTGGGNGVSFTNATNDFSGGLNITARQIGTSIPLAGTGSTIGSGPVTITSGTFRIRDNGTADNGTIGYGNALNVATAAAPNAIASTIDVDRQLAGLFAGNAVQFSALGITGGSTLNTIGGNGYQVHILGLTTVTGAGDVTFNADTASLALVGGIGAGGHGIVKNGAGVLAIGGGSAHTGNTTINAGTLGTNGQLSATPLVDVKLGATLDVALVAGGATFGAGQTLSGAGTVTGSVIVGGGAAITAGNAGAGNLTISGNLSAGISSLNIAITGGVPTSILVGGDVTSTGAASSADFFISSNSLAIGTYTLVNYTGALTGFTGFGIGALPPRVIAGLVDNVANTSIDLNVTGVDFPVWTGLASNAWTTAVVAAPKNWKESAGLGATDFITTDRVLFNDTATGTTTVAITDADVTVSGLTFDNSALNYTLDGPFGIAGAVNLDKSGTGKVTINNTNSFSGNVNITGGTVSVGAVANSGVASALGAGSAVSIDNGAALELTAGGSTNRAINIGAAGGTVKATAAATPTLAGVTTATGNFTLDDAGATTVSGNIGGGGAVTLTGTGTTTVSGNITAAGALTKSGTGTAILTGAGNTPASVSINAGTLQVGDGVANGSIGTGILTNNAALVLNNGAALTVANEITGTGTLTKNGTGQLNLTNVVANTNTGVTTVNAGTVVLTSTSGINNIGGDLVVNTGATVAYGTTAGQLQDHVADSATITVNGGTFGSGAGNTLAAPTAAVTDTVANVIVQAGGTFLSGRNATVTPFTITGALGVADGTALVSRGGALTAASVSVAGPGVINLDGGSTTAGVVNASTLNVGAGGISITGANINLNNGPSAVGAGSRGSIIALGGDLTSSGVSSFIRVSAETAPLAQIDLGGNDRTFNVTDTLTVGTQAAKVNIVNGGVTKTGPGNLVLGGDNTFAGALDVQTGTVTLTGTLSAATPINVDGGANFDVAGAVGGFTLGATQSITGNGSVIGAVNIAGTVAPGDSIGTLSFSSTVTFDVGGGSISQFEISKAAGPVYTADLLTASGLLTYDGTLAVTHTGLALAAGDTFNLFDAPSFAGTFDSFNLPALAVGLSWDTSDLPVDGTISVIPEPGSVTLLLGGLAMLAARRRREK